MYKARWRILFPAWLTCALVVLAGCHSGPMQDASQGTVPSDGATHIPAPPLTVEEVFPWIMAQTGTPVELEASTPYLMRYRITAGKRQGEIMLVSQQREDRSVDDSSPDRASGQLWEVTRRIDGEDKPAESRLLSLTAEPAVHLTRLENIERNLLVEMDPDPVAMPRELVQGVVQMSDHTMRLPTLTNPKNVREQGTGRMRLTYLGEEEILTEAGAFRAKRTREIFESKLKFSNATRTIDRWYVAGLGLVAEKYEEVVKALGITVESTEFEMRLIVAPAAEPAGQ